MLSTHAIAYQLVRNMHPSRTAGAPKPLHGREIFDGSNAAYPRSWDEYIGQERAKMQLRVAIRSARERQARMDHILIASGTPGIGKTALALLTAYTLGVGVSTVSGRMDAKQLAAVLKQMDDGDVLFIDEIHRLVDGGKRHAEVFLHLMQDGVLMLPTGQLRVPDVTIMGATTDAQRLPRTIIDRFVIKPQLVEYTTDEAVQIAAGMARRLGFGERLPMPEANDWLVKVVTAANHNPREGYNLLITVRDIALSSEAQNFDGETYDLSLPLEWAGLTEDGLNPLAQQYLLVLAGTFDGTAGERALSSTLAEPGGLSQTEQLLVSKGFIAHSPKGRTLTDRGWERAGQLTNALTQSLA
jgi:Holliday junction DNA helicase RuvB